MIYLVKVLAISTLNPYVVENIETRLLGAEYKINAASKSEAIRYCLNNCILNSNSDMSYIPYSIDDKKIVIKDRYCNIRELNDNQLSKINIDPALSYEIKLFKVKLIVVSSNDPISENQNILHVSNEYNITANTVVDAIRFCLRDLRNNVANKNSIFVPVSIDDKPIFILDGNCNIATIQ